MFVFLVPKYGLKTNNQKQTCGPFIGSASANTPDDCAIFCKDNSKCARFFFYWESEGTPNYRTKTTCKLVETCKEKVTMAYRGNSYSIPDRIEQTL